jgi:LysM repeat protein
MKIWFITLLFWLGFLCAYAQPSERRISREEYIEQYKDVAIKEMQTYGIPASITLAQGILESDGGNSALARYANNHFGIKCHTGWDGSTYIQDDDTKNECFRKYHNAYHSFKDHSEFLSTRNRYAELFTFKSTDYESWAHGLKKAGYATNPKYPELLIKLINDYQLHQYDISEKEVKKEKNKEFTENKPIQKTEKILSSKIQIHENNIEYVIAQKGDSYYSIASQNQMNVWQLIKYNEVDKNYQPKEGEIVFLQPKRNKAKTNYYIVSKSETLWDISQQFGIKLKKLEKLNGISRQQKLKKGQEIKLK